MAKIEKFAIDFEGWVEANGVELKRSVHVDSSAEYIAYVNPKLLKAGIEELMANERWNHK